MIVTMIALQITNKQTHRQNMAEDGEGGGCFLFHSCSLNDNSLDLYRKYPITISYWQGR